MDSRTVTTRIALVETAERLFAERGIETVSLRDVSAAAGQRNHSAAQYHFGDRSGLVAATFEHRMTPVNAERAARLEVLTDEDRLGDPASLVEAFVAPLVGAVAGTESWYGRFLARARWDTFAMSVLDGLPAFTSASRTTELIAATMGHLPPALRRRRIEQMSTLVIGTVGGWESQRDRGEAVLAPDALSADLVITATALIRAAGPTTA